MRRITDNTCAFYKEGNCGALNENFASCVNCNFKKTPEQLIRGRECSRIRIEALSPELQEKIKAKYPSNGWEDK